MGSENAQRGCVNYREAVAYLNSLVNFERLPETRHKTDTDDLTRFSEMLSNLGNPQNDFPTIHIAGTKGKGSTAAIISSILQKAGYKVGLYTSPHLITVRERVRINDADITKERFAKLMSLIISVPDLVRIGEQAAFRTVFEHLTAIALLDFSKSRVDIAVIETGLGGRLDSTVVLDPILSILTPIGLDHTALLGDTVEAIASEKSYIIKRGVPAVSAPQKPSVQEIFSKRARNVNSEFVIAPGKSECKNAMSTPKGSSFTGTREWFRDVGIDINLHGEFQLINTSTALSAIEILRNGKFEIDVHAVTAGLKSVKWAGRMDIKTNRATVILDGAHNGLGVGVLAESVKKIFTKNRWRVVFASMKNKNALEMLKILQPNVDKLYLAPLQFPKSLDKQMLEELTDHLEVPSDVFNSSPEAYEAALVDLEEDEVVLVTGSLYLVGEIYRHLDNIPPPAADGSIDDRI